jgi:hypothetical protein
MSAWTPQAASHLVQDQKSPHVSSGSAKELSDESKKES